MDVYKDQKYQIYVNNVKMDINYLIKDKSVFYN